MKISNVILKTRALNLNRAVMYFLIPKFTRELISLMKRVKTGFGNGGEVILNDKIGCHSRYSIS
jgi:hypothetical protein